MQPADRMKVEAGEGEIGVKVALDRHAALCGECDRGDNEMRAELHVGLRRSSFRPDLQGKITDR